MLVNLDWTSYLGQFRNDLQDERHKLLFNKVEYIDINKKGKMEGIGILKRAEVSIKNAYYKNGIKMSEEEYNKSNGLNNIIINIST